MTHYASQELINRAAAYDCWNRYCGGNPPEPSIEIVRDLAKATPLPGNWCAPVGDAEHEAAIDAWRAKVACDLGDAEDGLLRGGRALGDLSKLMDAATELFRRAPRPEPKPEPRASSEVEQLRDDELDEATKRADGLRSDVAYWQNIVESAVRACASPGLLHIELVAHIEQLSKDRDEARAALPDAASNDGDDANPTLLAVCEELGADVDSVEAQAKMFVEQAKRVRPLEIAALDAMGWLRARLAEPTGSSAVRDSIVECVDRIWSLVSEAAKERWPCRPPGVESSFETVEINEAKEAMGASEVEQLRDEHKELQARNDRQVEMLLARESELESISGELETLKQSIYDHLRDEDANDERGDDDDELSPVDCVEAAGDEILRLLARAEKAEAESEDLRSKVDKLNRVSDTLAELAVLSLRRSNKTGDGDAKLLELREWLNKRGWYRPPSDGDGLAIMEEVDRLLEAEEANDA